MDAELVKEVRDYLVRAVAKGLSARTIGVEVTARWGADGVTATEEVSLLSSTPDRS
jgi:hypothetical protein